MYIVYNVHFVFWPCEHVDNGEMNKGERRGGGGGGEGRKEEGKEGGGGEMRDKRRDKD